MSDIEKVRMALEFGSENTPALTHEPVFVWTNAEAALDRIEAEVERLRQHNARLVRELKAYDAAWAFEGGSDE